MSGFASDLRVVLRTLGRTPGFALAAVGTLGLGMATTIAALLLVKGYLFTALPYPAAAAFTMRYTTPWQSPAAWKPSMDVAFRCRGQQVPGISALLPDWRAGPMVPGAWVTRVRAGPGIQPAMGAASTRRHCAAPNCAISHGSGRAASVPIRILAGRSRPTSAIVRRKRRPSLSSASAGRLLARQRLHRRDRPLRAPTYPPWSAFARILPSSGSRIGAVGSVRVSSRSVGAG